MGTGFHKAVDSKDWAFHSLALAVLVLGSGEGRYEDRGEYHAFHAFVDEDRSDVEHDSLDGVLVVGIHDIWKRRSNMHHSTEHSK